MKRIRFGITGSGYMGRTHGEAIKHLGAAAELVASGERSRFVCQECRHPLAPAEADPKQGALRRNVRIDTLSPWNRYGLVEEIELREFYCPSCMHMIAVQVAKKADPPLLDTFLSVKTAFTAT